MNWDEFYKLTGNATVYWFATGCKPSYDDVVVRSFL